MAKKCARTFSIVVEKGKKSILEVTHLLPDALPRSVRPGAKRSARSRRPPPNARLHSWIRVPNAPCNGQFAPCDPLRRQLRIVHAWRRWSSTQQPAADTH